MIDELQYDLALSFAVENRDYVGMVAGNLREKGVKLFYDRYEQVSLSANDLYKHLQDIYANRTDFTVLFLSNHYAQKLWKNMDCRQAQARAFRENIDYILPVFFDQIMLPGLEPSNSFIDLQITAPEKLAELIFERLSLGANPRGTAGSKLNKFELKDKTLNTVSALRNLLLGTAWNSWYLAVNESSSRLMSSYIKEYKLESIALRDELIYRIPFLNRDKYLDIIYEHPMNPSDLEEIGNDLESLAKFL